jgi:hypothetical protein
MSQFIYRLLALAFVIAILGASVPTFRVINTSDSGAGLFRQTIFDANGSAGADSADLINNGQFTSPVGVSAVHGWATVNNINVQRVGAVARRVAT